MSTLAVGVVSDSLQLVDSLVEIEARARLHLHRGGLASSEDCVVLEVGWWLSSTMSV